MNRWVKKHNLIAAAAAVGLVSLLVYFFLDFALKRALIAAGQAAAGAKVEIASVKSKVLKGTLALGRVAVADKNAPMKNLFELERADFKLSLSGLVRAKIVVDDASVSGLRLGTTRTTSGALPLAPPSALEKALAEQLAPAKSETLAALGKAKNTAAEFDPKTLSAPAALDAAQAKLDALTARAKDHAAVDRIKAQYQEIEKEAAVLREGGSGPDAIVRKAAAAQRVQEKSKALLVEVKQAKETVEKDVAEVRAALAKADELRKKDLDGLLAAAGLPTLDAESLTKRLVGPAAAQKLSTALYWVKWARQRRATSTKERLSSPTVARRGVDVEFPVADALPLFLLRRAALDGRHEDLSLKGELRGVTSNPAIYGKPATLELAGTADRGVSLSFDGRMEQGRADGATEIRLRYAGFALAGAALGDGEISAALTAGTGRLDGALKLKGDEWSGRFVLEAEGVALEPKTTLEGRAGQFATQALKGVRRFTATVGIEGRGDDMKLSLTSDLGRALADGLKAAASGELMAQKKILEQKLDAALGPRAKEMQGRAAALQKQLLGPLDAQQTALNEQIKKAVGGALPVKGLDGLFKRR